MANLFNQNIGINYKGILNLDTTINTPLDATLRAQVNVGGGTSLGRLTVKGDGTNPIARFDTSAGGFIFQVLNTGLLWGNGDNGQGGRLQGGGSGLFYIGQDVYNYGSMPNWISFSAGTGILVSGVAGAYMPSDGFFGIIRTFSNDASQIAFTQNQDYKFINHRYTINNTRTSTGTATGLFLNATETALNGITHNLMDLQVGGVSKIRIANNGFIYLNAASNAYINGTVGGQLNIVSNSGSGNPVSIGSNGEIKVYYNNTELNAPISNTTPIKLGGTTSSFPAIKRNGAAIDFRLADDSAACNITASSVNGNGIVCLSAGGVGISQISNITTYGFHMSRNFVVSWGSNTQLDGSLDTAIARYSANVVRISNASTGAGNLFIGASTGYNASAVLQADSTTQGFLPPRQTQAQRLAIASPAIGLLVYQTDTVEGIYIYKSTGWQFVA